MTDTDQLVDLPLTGKIQTASIFELLQLPTSSDLTKVRKGYYKKADDLEKVIKNATDPTEKEELSKNLRLLEKTFQDFSQNIQNNTQEIYQAQQALKGLGLDKNADWDAIENQYKNNSGTASEENYRTLKQKEDWFKKNTGLPAKTIFASLGILAAAGVTIAAMSQFAGGSLSDSVKSLGNSMLPPAAPAATASPEETLAAGAQAQHEQVAGLDQYIENNMALEDDLLSTMGVIPDMHESLSVDFKVQMLQSMIKHI